MTRNILRLLFLLVVICMTTVSASSQTKGVLRAADYGLKPNTYENSTPLMQRLLQLCKEKQVKTLLLDNGRYDFWPEGAVKREIFVSNTSDERECPSKVKTLGILLENQQDITIDGQGAMLMFHGKMTMIAMIHCKNVTLQNLSIDQFRPGGSELTIEKVSADGVDVRFHPDSWYDIQNGEVSLVGEGWRTNHPHCVAYYPATDHFQYSEGWNILQGCKAEQLEQGLVRFHAPEDYKPEVGSVLTVRDRYRDEVGLLNLESEGLVVRDVNIHYMHAIGFINQFSRDVTMQNVRCMPREGSGRVLASSADFFHFSGCSGKISILGCSFSGAQDDPINVHGTNLRAMEKLSDRSLRLRFMHGQSYGMKAFWPGDTIAFVHAESMQRFAEAVVEKVERLSDKEVALTVDRTVPSNLLLDLDVVENLTCTPEVEVRGCYFTHTNTRGTLVTTPRKVVIADNTYERTGNAAILIAADAMDWFESGPVNDVTIENNRFVDCNYSGEHQNAVISIEPSNEIIDKKKPVHRNIRILNNTFETCGNRVLYAKSTQGLTFLGNKVTGTSPADWYLLEGCSKIKLQK